MIIAEFMSKVEKTSYCWLWKGKCPQKGYGRCHLFWKSYREQQAHRTSWMLFRTKGKPIPKGLHVLHKCDNPRCVNPEHLYLGTNKDNVRDKVERNRTGKEKRWGELSIQAKLTEANVREIRSSKEPLRTFATKFGVTVACISQIRLRKNWKHIP